MKKTITLIATAIISSLAFVQSVKGQTDMKDGDGNTYDYFYEYGKGTKLTKTDKAGVKKYTKDLGIPNKENDESIGIVTNNPELNVVGDNIIAFYYVWQDKTKTKDCMYKLIDTKTGKVSAGKVLFSAKINSKFSTQEIPMTVAYSPDNTKVAVIKDNTSPSYNIDDEIFIYDTKTLQVLKSKNLGQKYEGQKRVFDTKSMKMDNAGNIFVSFSLMNTQTKMTTKSYTASLPYESAELKDIKEMSSNGATMSEESKSWHGHFYKTFQDYVDDKPIPGVRIKSGSYTWSILAGNKFKLIDDDGNLLKEKAQNLPSDFFTYKRDETSSAYFIRLIDGTPYIVLALGKLCFYSLHEEQDKLFIAEGFEGKLEKFREKDLEKKLESANLLEDYKKDKPKVEKQDDYNSIFNKKIAWYIKYIMLLNKNK